MWSNLFILLKSRGKSDMHKLSSVTCIGSFLFRLSACVFLQCLIIFHLVYSNSLLTDLPASRLASFPPPHSSTDIIHNSNGPILLCILLCSSKPFSISRLPRAGPFKLWFVIESRQNSKPLSPDSTQNHKDRHKSLWDVHFT